LRIWVVIAAAQDASSAEAKIDTIMPIRIRTLSWVNRVCNCSPVSFGDGGGMNPATPANPRKNSTRQATPLHAHSRWARAFINNLRSVTAGPPQDLHRAGRPVDPHDISGTQ
jgi:hypothetical protein